MSIIYDALKKIEKTVDNGSVNQKAPKTKRLGKPKPILIYILVIMFGLFVGNIAFGILTRPKVKLTPSPALITTVTPVNKIPAPSPAEKSTPPPVAATEAGAPTAEPALALNGVFFQQDKGYALINNRILTVGDTIQEAKVEEISLGKVVLDLAGKKITLINSSR